MVSKEDGWFIALNALVFKGLVTLHINKPEIATTVIRLMMALLSFHTIIAGYKMVNQLYNQRIAAFTGILLAGFWFVPWLSVRNLALMAAVPLFMTALFFLNLHLRKPNYILPFLTGILCTIGFLLAYDTWIFVALLFLTLLFSANYITSLVFITAFSLSFISVQVPFDVVNQVEPLAAVSTYFLTFFHQIQISSQWYLVYVLPFILMIPPVSFFLFRGLATSFKNLYYITIPTILTLFCSIFFAQSTVELMLFTLPFVIVAGSSGWVLFLEKSKFWARHNSGYYLVLLCFWGLNFFLLPFASTLYARQTEIEAMQYLANYKPVRSFVCEQTGSKQLVSMPLLYLNHQCTEIVVNQSYPPDSLQNALRRKPDLNPQFILFYGEKDLKHRIESMYPVLPNISYVTSLEPGITESMLKFFITDFPAETIVVYRNNYYTQSPVN